MMKMILRVLKIIGLIGFLFSIAYFFYYKICIDAKMEGSLLNGSKIEDNKYYLEDNSGDFIEIAEIDYKKLVVKTKLFMICLMFIIIYLICIWFKFLIFPNVVKYIKLFREGNT